MRLLKSASMVLGLAASGGMVLILSGNAFAAEGDAVITSQPSPAVTIQNKQTTTQKSDVQNPAASSDIQVSVTHKAQTTGDSAAAPVASSTATPSPEAKAAATPAAAPKTEVNSANTAVVVGAAIPKAAVESVSTASAPVAALAQPIQPPTAAEPAVVRAAKLPLRPMITHTAAPAVIDLASQLPTAVVPSVPEKHPTPAQPSGLLGQLTAQLAVSEVKVPFLPGTTSATLAALFTLTFFLSLLGFNKTVTVLVHRARREGFAYSPRSDVAVATFNSLFATPLFLGYVTATPART